jgi:hypothetical protein
MRLPEQHGLKTVLLPLRPETVLMRCWLMTPHSAVVPRSDISDNLVMSCSELYRSFWDVWDSFVPDGSRRNAPWYS